MTSISRDRAIALYRKILWIRCCEQGLSNRYGEQEMRTPTHFGVGQEAVAGGVCEALEEGDVAYTHHRSHNHYLAKGGSFLELAAELYGRETGCSRGRGGSVHLTARDKGFIISSAILGETIAVAVGSALAFKMDGLPHAAVCFFGDAVCEEGIFYESLNYASIHKLPVLFVCENNLYSTESTLDVRQPRGTRLRDRVRVFQAATELVDGNNVFEVWEKARHARARIAAGGGPQFLECMTYRWLEHVGPQYDHLAGRDYRSEAELKAWMDRCPLLQAADYLVGEGFATREEIGRWEAETREKVASLIEKARAEPWPKVDDLFENVY